MHKPKVARKARLNIVAMHDPNQVKKFSALMQSTSASPDMSVGISLKSKKIYTRMHWSPSEKIHIPTKTGLKKTSLYCLLY